MLRSIAAALALFAFGATAEAQFDTRFAFSVEGGGGALTEIAEEDDGLAFLGGAGGLMLGARIGQPRPLRIGGTLSWVLAYQGSFFADSSAILHRHHATVALRVKWLTAIFGVGPTVVTPLDGAFEGTVGASITIDERVVFGQSGVFLGIPFKIDFLPKSDLALMQLVLTLGFQTF